MWSPRKTLVLHNSRETLAWLLNRRIRHLFTTYKMQNVWTSIPSILCIWCSGGMIQDDRIWQSYAMWYDAMALAYKLFVHSFSLLKSLFFFLYGHFTKCTNQDSNCVYAGTNFWHKRWYDTNMIWYVCNGWCRPLMCTSNVAGNTQMASLDRQVTQNGLGVNNAMAREYTMEGYHDTKMIWRLPSLAMMSGGVLDVDTKMMETHP